MISTTGFLSFDSLTGGLDPAKTYLIYGNNRTGKTTFTLGFTAEGLNRGERCVYVSGRPAESIIAQGAAFGFNLEPHLQNQSLVILEYPENVRENSTQLLDDSRIFGEFKAIIGAEHFDRIVFDPVSPLVAGLSAASAPTRLRSMVRLFTAGGATVLYVAGTANQDNHLAVCKEAVHGVLRFEREGPEGTPNTLVVERLSGVAPGANSTIRFEVVPGIGLREAAEEETAESLPPAPRAVAHRLYSFPASSNTQAQNGTNHRQTSPILLIHPDAGERSQLRSLLEKLRPVVEASGAADGISLLSTAAPAVVVVAHKGRGVTGIEIVRKIRHSGRSVPILMLSTQCKRRTDVVEPLQAGVDVCLADPPDSRALALHINNFLSRAAGRSTPQAAVLDYTPPPREVGCTGDLDYFLARLEMEANYAQEYGGHAVVVTLREPFNCSYTEELSNLTSVLVRSSDLVYSGPRGVAILLADADASAFFLARFRSRWTEAMPGIDEFRPADGADYLESARDFLLSTIATARGGAPAAPRVLAANTVNGAPVARIGEY